MGRYDFFELFKVTAIHSLDLCCALKTDVGRKARDGALQEDILKGVEKVIFLEIRLIDIANGDR